MSPFGMRPTKMSIRSTTYRLVSLTSFRCEKISAEKTIAFSSRVGRSHNEGIADLVFSASRRSEMSLHIVQTVHLTRQFFSCIEHALILHITLHGSNCLWTKRGWTLALSEDLFSEWEERKKRRAERCSCTCHPFQTHILHAFSFVFVSALQ